MKDLEQVPSDPTLLFKQWYSEAQGNAFDGSSFFERSVFGIKKIFRNFLKKIYPPLSMHQPDSMILASATKEGRPSVRTVLLKGLKDGAPVFYTNYNSRKGRELEDNPFASAIFHWGLPERQIRFEGRIERLAAEESDKYWNSRPFGSRISGMISPQSDVIPNREFLVQKVQQANEKYRGQDVPRPEFWGGYQLVPERVEFWQGAVNRLHYRVLYERDGSSWKRSLLAP